MRKVILLLIVLSGVSLSCVELAELLTLSDDTSNDIVLVLSGQKCGSPHVAKEPSADVFSEFIPTVERKTPHFVMIDDSVLACRKLISEFGVQRK